MRPELDQARTRGTPGYEALPVAVRQFYTPAEWLCLPDSLKASLVESECEPDTFEDGL